MENTEHNSEERHQGAIKLATKSALLPNNRPVEARHLEVASTYGSMSSVRPVMKSNLEIKGSLTVSGKRPITASHLQISESAFTMGNRPVASNQMDDTSILMGYLD